MTGTPEEQPQNEEEEYYELSPKGEMYFREVLFRYKRGDSLDAIASDLEINLEELTLLFTMGEFFGIAEYEDPEEDIPDTLPPV